MKTKMFTIVSVITICSTCYAYSKNFEYMTSTMNIETKTEHGHLLNEDIYNAYNQFVYGSPLIVTSGQRWKDVDDGRWTKNGGIWSGSGTRGEYWILGYNYTEEYIHNHQFPADAEPPTPPTQWRYVVLPDAIQSWNNTELYIHEEQKMYMQTAHLTRNNTVYDITAMDIGLDKAKVENYATWKTNGNIYTRRYDMNSKEWAANFIVPPMAGDASLQSELFFPNGDSYTIKKDEESIVIPVEYGCKAIDLTDFAKAEHVKLIRSELIANDRKIDDIKNEKCLSINDKGSIVVNKNDFSNQAVIEFEVSCNSVLLTEFNVDDILTDVETKIIVVYVDGVEKEDIVVVDKENENYTLDAIPPRIDDISLSVTENGKDIPLKINKKTNSSFICAGQVLVINVEASHTDYISLEFSGDRSIITLDELTKKFEWDEPRSRGIANRYTSLAALQSAYKNVTFLYPYNTEDSKSYYQYYYVIPYKTKQTLHSWSSLREMSRDAFSIDETQLFSRISKPYGVVIKAYSKEGIRTKGVSLDVFERWDTLYNRDLTPYIRKKFEK